MRLRPQQMGYHTEKVQAERAWRERHEEALAIIAASKKNAKKTAHQNRDHVTGQLLPGKITDLGPDVSSFAGKTPLQVLRHFFPHLAEESRSAWHVFLKAAFNEPLTDEERLIYQQCTGRTEEFAETVREMWLICGRRAGKSEIVAFLAVYLGCFRKYKRTKGSDLVGMVLAADREQAGVIMRYISEMLHSHKRLESLIKRRGSLFRETQQSIVLTTGITIKVYTSNYRRVRGYTVAFVLCDEIAFWEAEDAANPDHEVLKALRPALGTTEGILICLSSPYWQKGELFKTYQKHFGRDDSRVFVWKAATRVMNPTFPQGDIDAATEEDPAAAAAEYGAEFRTDVQALFEPTVIQACSSVESERLPQAGVSYRAFVDPAGGSGQDSMTLGVAHTHEGIEVLDCVREIRPPFNPDDATKELAETIKAYRLSSVTGDRYAGEWPRERFRTYGVDYLLSDRTKTEIYRALLPMVNAKRVDLLTHSRMLTQMQNLERHTARGGRDSIDHPRAGHDDVINAAAGALVCGSTSVQYRVRCVDGPARPVGGTVVTIEAPKGVIITRPAA